MMNKIPGDFQVKEKILLYNSRSTHSGKRRLPLTLLSLGAVLQPNTFSIIDGNIDPDPEAGIMEFLSKHPEYRFVGITVMPGEQIKGALKASRLIRSNFPSVKIS